MQVLTLTSLYPNSEMPRHGIFVRERLRQLCMHSDARASVIAPVPWFPSADPRFGSYARYARIPAAETEGQLVVYHPRFVAVPRIGNAFTPLGYAWSATRCIRQNGLGNADIIDAHYAFPDGAAAVRVARALSKPIVLTVRGSDINVLSKEPAAGWWIKRTLRACDAIIAVSDALRLAVVSMVPEHADRVVTIRNGVDQNRFRVLSDRASIRHELGLSGDVVVSVGNLVPLKRHDLAIAALQNLPRATLVVVGEGSFEGHLRAHAQACGVADRVRFQPNVPQDQLVMLYNAADVLVLASESEGMPNVVLESLACGTPVVATSVGGIPEVVVDPIAGTLVEDKTADAISGALRQVLSVPRARDAVRAQVAHLDWPRTAAAIYAICADVLSRTAGQRSSTIGRAA